VTVCGSGAGGHVLAGLLSARGDVDTRVFTMNSEKARRWRSIMTRARLSVVERDGATERTLAISNPTSVTADPAEAARGCDLAIFVIPAFLHAEYLAALAPFLEDGCVVVGLPGQPGFEFDVRETLGRVGRSFTVINFDSLPWICRLSDLGRKVTVLGTKERLVGAMQGDRATARMVDPVSTLQLLFGEAPRLLVSGHVLGITLRSPNASNHPPMMYSRWRDWTGEQLDAPPLFYEGIDQAGADLLGHVSEELVATAQRIMAMRPGTDLRQVIPQYQWEIDYYGRSIADASSLLSALRTNAGYAGITHPMVPAPSGGYHPDFGHRFLSEDVPFGLAVMRGVAEIAGIPTPHIDTVLNWSQARLGRRYLDGTTLTGRDLRSTRCPQRYGIAGLDALLGDDGYGAAARVRRGPTNGARVERSVTDASDLTAVPACARP
jgi:hypothetical protein